MQYLDAISKNNRMISVCFQGKPFNITVIQVYALTSNTEEAEVEQFYEDLQDLLELTPEKDVLFIIRDGTTDWFQIGKGVRQGCVCHPAYLTYMQSTS